MIKLEGVIPYHDMSSAPAETGRALVPTSPITPPIPIASNQAPPPLAAPDSELTKALGKFDVRSMSPREMAGRSIELYAIGMVSWDEYAMLAFQPELHPSYDKTIGALLGEKAEPDRQRDFLVEWEERLAFEVRYNAADADVVNRTRHIVQSFRKLAGIRSQVTV